MHHRSLVALASGTILLLAACSSGGGTTPTSAPSAAPSAAPPAAVACAESAAPGEVKVAVADFAFNPAAISAKVGETITFSNSDSAPHTATLDDGTCTTPNIASGKSDGLLFTVAGTYPFHCSVHPTMKGTITVS